MKITNTLFRNLMHKHLGLQSYNFVMATMKQIATRKTPKGGEPAEESCDVILTCEHHPVYTVGIRTQDYVERKMIDNLKALSAEFEYTDRGGLITFHGPGQLVCYPVLNLKHYNISLRCYIHKLEEAIINTCKEFGIQANRTNDIGIWIGNDKVAAIGVHCKKYVTYHGLALNCNTDLSWFDHIVPCGLHGKGVTSLSKLLGHEITTEQALPVLLRNFQRVFEATITPEKDCT